MSKLSRLMHVTQGRRVAIIDPAPVMRVTEKIEQVIANYAYEYKIGVELYASVTCKCDDIDKLSPKVRAHIIQGVFGEFREPLRAVYGKLFSRDVDGALVALQVLEQKMFEDEA